MSRMLKIVRQFLNQETIPTNTKKNLIFAQNDFLQLTIQVDILR